MKKIFKVILLSIVIILNLNMLFAQSQTALSFDGNNDHVSLGNNLGFEYTDEFTVEAWVKTNGNGFRQIISKLDASFKGWGLQINNGHLSAYVSSTWGTNFSIVNGSGNMSGGTLINDGVWHHVAMVYDGSTNITLYIDGVIENPLNSTNNLSSSTLNSGTTEIGCYDANGSPGEFWVGEIENISIYDTQRLQTEIQSDMYNCLNGSENNLLAYYNFNDGTNSPTISDLTSNNYNGTLINMDPSIDWVVGVYSGVLIADIRTECDSLVWIDGNTYYTDNNTATFNTGNETSSGCDTLIVLDLTISPENPLVIQSGILLTAGESGATYQWLDCLGMTPINGATNQSYSATTDGDYAVVVTNNGCSNTSDCYTITGVGLIENDFGNELSLYPNPTNGEFSIDLGGYYTAVKITVMDLSGKLIQSKTYNGFQLLNMKLEEPSGVYFVGVQSGNNKTVIRFLKE